MLDFETLCRENTARCNESFHSLFSWSPMDWAAAMAGEAGEACNLIKKMRRLVLIDSDWGSRALKDRKKVREVVDELADVVIYADLLASRIGERLDRAIQRKFNEVSKRIGSPRRLTEPGPLNPLACTEEKFGDSNNKRNRGG